MKQANFFELKKRLYSIVSSEEGLNQEKVRAFKNDIESMIDQIMEFEISQAIEDGKVPSDEVRLLFKYRGAMIPHRTDPGIKDKLKLANHLMKNFDRKTKPPKDFLELLDGVLSRQHATPSEELDVDSVFKQFQEMLDKKKAKHLNWIKKLPLHKLSFEEITRLQRTIEVHVNKPPPGCGIVNSIVWAAREKALRTPSRKRTAEDKQAIHEGNEVFKKHDQWAKKFKPILRYIEGIWLMQQRMNKDMSFTTWSQYMKQHGFADARSRGGTSGDNTPVPPRNSGVNTSEADILDE